MSLSTKDITAQLTLTWLMKRLNPPTLHIATRLMEADTSGSTTTVTQPANAQNMKTAFARKEVHLMQLRLQTLPLQEASSYHLDTLTDTRKVRIQTASILYRGLMALTSSWKFSLTWTNGVEIQILIGKTT